MRKTSELPDALKFLSWVLEDQHVRYQSPWWLTSPFTDSMWSCDFGRGVFTLSFDLLLDDGLLFTSPGHEDLLTAFKYWLCVQVHPDNNQGRPLGRVSAFNLVSRVARLIDYFLLNSRHLNLCKAGIGALTTGDLRALIVALSESHRSANSIYRWKEMLTSHLRALSASISEEAYCQALEEKPELAALDNSLEERVLFMEDDALIRARVSLWISGLYRQGKGTRNFRFEPDIPQLTSEIYSNLLWAGRLAFPMPLELCIDAIDRYDKEYEGVPCRTALEDQLDQRQLGAWRSSILSLDRLECVGVALPRNALDAIAKSGWMQNVATKREGRFRSLPNDVVLTQLKQSIEFVLTNGDILLDAYIRLVKVAVAEGLSIAKYKVDPRVKTRMYLV